MSIHLIDPVTVTGAGGGIGSAVMALLTSQSHARVRGLHRDDSLAAPDDALGLVLCHAAPLGATLAEQLETDVVLARRAIDARAPGMTRAGRGAVVLFSSIRAHHPRRGQADYAASKAAVEGLARGLAVDLAPAGIAVNVVAPGALDTPRTRENIRRGVVQESELVGPLGRMATAEEVARVVGMLLYASPPSLTGQVVTVDAGWTAQG